MICETQVMVIDGDYHASVIFGGDPYRDLHVLDPIEIDGRSLIIASKSEICGIGYSAYSVMILARANLSEDLHL